MPPLMRHNPAFLAPEELDAGFVVRLGDLSTVLDIIRENTDRSSNQHLLIIAARGMGKSTLVLRAANAVRADETLSKSWYPIIWGEEAYQVGTAGEFWLETLLHLGDQTADRRWEDAHAELLDEPDEQRLQERALARLMDFADEQGRRLLIVVENLQMILGEQMAQRDKDSGWVLRHTLQNEPRIMLLATSTVRFAQISKRSEALYELFFEHRLDPLTREECRTLWQKLSGSPLSAGRARPIEILTGGNTRLLSILASFAAGRTFQELMTDLVQLVDEHTDYFKSNFEALSLSERRVFSALADLWQPSLAREVARQARVSVSEASRDLGRMEARGLITVVGEQGRAKLYQLTERLYNLYHLMRRRGNPAQRVRAAVEFIVHLYPEDDVKPVLTRIAGEALGLESCLRQDHVWAWTEVARRLEPDLRRAVMLEAPREFWRLPDLPKQAWEMVGEDEEVLRAQFPLVFEAMGRLAGPSSDADFADWAKANEVDLQVQLQRWQEKLPDMRRIWVTSAVVHWMMGHSPEAAEAARRAIQLADGSAHLWFILAMSLNRTAETLDERTQAFRRAAALSQDDGFPWAALGRHLADERGDAAGAAKAMSRAVSLSPDRADRWCALAEFRATLGDTPGAREALLSAEQVCGQDLRSLKEIGNLWITFGAWDQAERVVSRICDLEPLDAVNSCVLGFVQLQTENYQKATSILEISRKLDPRNFATHANLGIAYGYMERPQEAEATLRTALEIAPDQTDTRINLGAALMGLDRLDEAEAEFRTALDADSKNAFGWLKLGVLLEVHRGDPLGAERAFRQALTASEHPDLEPAADHLTQFLLRQSRIPDALDAAREALARDNSSAEMLNSIAWNFCVGTSDPDALFQATVWAQQAVELSPDDLAIRHTYAALLGRVGRWQDSFSEARLFLADTDAASKFLDDVIDYFIEAAAAQQTRAALDLLVSSPTAALTEPLIVALRLELGENPRAPQEIAEVARDVVEKIHQRRAERSAPAA